MKYSALTIGGLAMAAAMISPATADNTDNKSVSVAGTIVAPLEIAVTPMTMPHIVRPATGEPSAKVTLQCGASGDATNTVSYTQGNGNPFANGVAAASSPSASSANKALPGANSTGTCAVLTITGESGYNFLPMISVVTSSTPGVTVSAASCRDELGNDASTGSPLQLTGTDLTVRCGATTTVTSASTATTYSASFTYSVTYD